MTNKPESLESLWHLTLAPLVWVMHFLACYLTSAIWCAKFAATSDSPNTLRWAIGLYTVIALLLIGGVGRIGYRRDRARRSLYGPHDSDTHEDRHSFIGFAMLLLAGLSAIATIYVGMVAVFVEGCS